MLNKIACLKIYGTPSYIRKLIWDIMVTRRENISQQAGAELCQAQVCWSWLLTSYFFAYWLSLLICLLAYFLTFLLAYLRICLLTYMLFCLLAYLLAFLFTSLLVCWPPCLHYMTALCQFLTCQFPCTWVCPFFFPNNSSTEIFIHLPYSSWA